MRRTQEAGASASEAAGRFAGYYILAQCDQKWLLSVGGLSFLKRSLSFVAGVLSVPPTRRVGGNAAGVSRPPLMGAAAITLSDRTPPSGHPFAGCLMFVLFVVATAETGLSCGME